MYTWNLLSLWATRKISWATVVYAMKSRPFAVAGYGGSYQVDPQELNEQHLGTMGSNPITGECFAAFVGTPLPAEFAELMSRGALVELKQLAMIKDAFCEVHPSRQILQFGPSIGRHLECDIPEWHERADATRYHYVGVCGAQPDLSNLAVGQVILAPGLIYQRS